jgi:uncharacterized membrane protein YgcG
VIAAWYHTSARAEPSLPNPPGAAFVVPDKYLLVNDYANVLTIEQSVALTAKLQALERHNGTQIVFLSVPSIGNESRLDYAIRVAERWDIGNNGQGNGVLFLVTQSQGVHILTGGGISGALPDAKVARIYRDTLVPLFERGEYEQGILATMDELVKAASGEETAPTFFDYTRPDGVYVSPTRGPLDRLIMTGAWRPLLTAALTILLMVYAAVLVWRRIRSAKRPA